MPGLNLAGYVLVGVARQPDQLVLTLREPPGRAPMRIRLVRPRTSEVPEIPTTGLHIARHDWRPSPGQGEQLRIDFVDGSGLRATSDQVVFDVV